MMNTSKERKTRDHEAGSVPVTGISRGIAVSALAAATLPLLTGCGGTDYSKKPADEVGVTAMIEHDKHDAISADLTFNKTGRYFVTEFVTSRFDDTLDQKSWEVQVNGTPKVITLDKKKGWKKADDGVLHIIREDKDHKITSQGISL